MTFENLEERLPEDKVELYFELSDKLKEPTKTTFCYLLDIASVAEKTNLTEEYMVFGGYAVLAHLSSQYGEKVTPTWRGSNDIDVTGSVDVLNTLRSFYNITDDNPSPNIKNKRTLKLYTNNENECKIDFTLDDKGFDKEVIYILGIPVNIATPISLIKHKSILSQDEEIHKIDIKRLLGVLEYRDEKIDNISSALNRDEMKALYDITRNYKPSENKRVGLLPSKKYISSLNNYLKKRLI